MDTGTKSRNLFLDKLSDLESTRVATVLSAPLAGIRAKHAWIAPSRNSFERLCSSIDPTGWQGWLRADPETYPPRFGVAIGDAYDEDDMRARLGEVEQRIGELAAAIEGLGTKDFVYYTKDEQGLLVPEESKSCRAAYSDALSAYDHRRRRGLETQVIFHADIPTDLHKGESPDVRPFSALLNTGPIRKAIARRLAQLRNMGEMILPPGYLEEASKVLSPGFAASRVDSLADSTLVDFQVLIGSGGMREYKELKLHLLSKDRDTAKRYQEAIWRRTGTAFLIALGSDGRVLEYASPPSARQEPMPNSTARDICRQQAAVPILIDGAIQCTVVVGAFMRAMLELAPNWLYMNCTKDLGDLEKAGNAATYMSAVEWTKSGLVYIPDRKGHNIVYTGQELNGGSLRVSGILPELGFHSQEYGNLKDVYQKDILPRFAGMMGAYEIPPEKIFLMGDIEKPEVRAQVLEEMGLTKQLPAVTQDGTVIRRYPGGQFEKVDEEKVTARSMPTQPVRVDWPRSRAQAPSCTIGGSRACRGGQSQGI